MGNVNRGIRSSYLKLARLDRAHVIALASINQLIRLRCQDFAGAHCVALPLSLRHYPLAASKSLQLPTIRPMPYFSKELDFSDWAKALTIRDMAVTVAEAAGNRQEITRHRKPFPPRIFWGNIGGEIQTHQVFGQHSTGFHTGFSGLSMHF
jgi:hypothetical protein